LSRYEINRLTDFQEHSTRETSHDVLRNTLQQQQNGLQEIHSKCIFSPNQKNKSFSPKMCSLMMRRS